MSERQKTQEGGVQDRHMVEETQVLRLEENIRRATELEEGRLRKAPDVQSLREEINDPKTGEAFVCDRITSPDDPRVSRIQKLMVAQFGGDEVDPIEITQSAIEGKTPESGKSEPRYIVTVLADADGEIKAFATGAVLPTRDRDHQPSEREAIIFGAYIETVPGKRRTGLGDKVFSFRLRAGESEAQLHGLEVKGYIGEIVDDPRTEAFLNRHGARRLYTKSEDGSYHEVPYVQPPLEWNQRTGVPERNAGSVPEHLMLKLRRDTSTISGEELMEMVRGIYAYNNYWGAEGFASKEAYRAHLRLMMQIEQRLEATIVGKELVMVTQVEREALQREGVSFTSHVKPRSERKA